MDYIYFKKIQIFLKKIISKNYDFLKYFSTNFA
jgi:hypothetical protein